MQRCDVAVVGGGPAGSSCAARLVRAGLDVVVVDKARFPRDKVCAGWITPAVLDLLELDLASYRRCGHVAEPITGFVLGLIDGGRTQVAYDTAVSYGIRRCEFDDYLLQRSGARLLTGEAVRSLRRLEDGWLLNDTLHARLLVGAGGHFCPVARHLGAEVGDLPGAVAAQELEFVLSAAQRGSAQVAPGVPELYFCPDLKGYGWALVKGDVLNVGLGREDRHRLGDHLVAFVAFLKRTGRIPADLPDRFHGHAYLLYGRHAPRRVVDDRVLLVGDAAGLAYPQSGEGIRPAVESGILAAEALLDAGDELSREALLPYARALVGRFGEPTTTQWLPAALQRRLAGSLVPQPWFARHVVLDRWFLHRHQPPLAATVAMSAA
jgi:flavin-dependent dehydrogenase